MNATIEISMYALSDDYKNRIIRFIQRVKQQQGIKVEVNGLSTQLMGDYDILMQVLKKEMSADLAIGKTFFLLKIGKGELTKDDLPEELR